MTLLEQLHLQRKARLMRLGFGPRLPLPPEPKVEIPPEVQTTAEQEGPRTIHPRDWLIVDSENRDFAEKPLLISEIQRLVAKRYGIRRSDMLSHRRTKDVILPRQIAMYLAKIMTLHSLISVGHHFQGRDHTTVLHAIRKIERLRKSNPEFDAEIASLEAAKEAPHHAC